MIAIRFERTKVDPCVFRKVNDGELEIMVIVHVDNNFAHAKYQVTMERFTAELGNKLKLKNMGDTSVFGDANPIKYG